MVYCGYPRYPHAYWWPDRVLIWVSKLVVWDIPGPFRGNSHYNPIPQSWHSTWHNFHGWQWLHIGLSKASTQAALLLLCSTSQLYQEKSARQGPWGGQCAICSSLWEESPWGQAWYCSIFLSIWRAMLQCFTWSSHSPCLSEGRKSCKSQRTFKERKLDW